MDHYRCFCCCLCRRLSRRFQILRHSDVTVPIGKSIGGRRCDGGLQTYWQLGTGELTGLSSRALCSRTSRLQTRVYTPRVITGYTVQHGTARYVPLCGMLYLMSRSRRIRVSNHLLYHYILPTFRVQQVWNSNAAT